MWEYHVDPAPGRTPPQWIGDEKTFRENANVNERLLNQRAAEGLELVGPGGRF
jgi:hypothetical protein